MFKGYEREKIFEAQNYHIILKLGLCNITKIMGTVQIFQLDENDNRTYGVELLEAFPKT